MLLIVAAFESMPVVMYGPMLTEMPPLAMVPEAEVPANAAVACTKSVPLFEAIAVVIALCAPVIVPAFSPKLIPFELLKVNAEARLLVVPALRLMFEIVAALESIPVVM